MFFLLPMVLVRGIPELNQQFYLFLGLRVVLDVFALSFYFFALKEGDISLVIPLSTFSVVFSLLSSAIINYELPNTLGIMGIVVIMIGTYFLNLPNTNRLKNILMPFKLVFSNVAARFILASAFLYGNIYSINKVGMENSSTSFFTFAAAMGLLICFSIGLLFKYKGSIVQHISISQFQKFFPLGIIDGVKIFLFMLAISFTYVSFADASDNTTAIYSTLLAGLVFGEKIKQRLLPILVMVLGVVLITVSTYL
jgi:uncharacterized membrane protein